MDRSADGLTWTFKIRPGMKWSDGQPATSEDARWTMQYVLDATKAERVLGAGYLEPYQTAAGVTGHRSGPDDARRHLEPEQPAPAPVVRPDPAQAHLVEARPEGCVDAASRTPAPIVGTGPYQVVEWKPAQFVRFARNPNYWGTAGRRGRDRHHDFKSDDTMVQALKNGELDYARDVPADQFDALKARPEHRDRADGGRVQRLLRARVQLLHGKPTRAAGLDDGAPGPGLPRRARLRDRQAGLIDQGVRRARHARQHPDHAVPGGLARRAERHPRRSTSTRPSAKLDAAGYALDASGKRLDKDRQADHPAPGLAGLRPERGDGRPAHRRLVRPARDQGQRRRPQDEAKLGAELLPPEADPPGKANYDMFIWGWVGDPDPTSLLKVLTTEEIGASQRQPLVEPALRRLYDTAAGRDRQHERDTRIVAQMQQIIYDEAPYHVLYYPSQLDAYRTDKFGGWKNQPSQNGNPLFGFGPLDYTYLTDANAPAPSPSASAAASSSPGASEAAVASAPAATASAAPAPVPTDTSSTNSPILLIVGIVVLVAALAVGFVMLRRGRAAAEEE